jgi:hypothetical protein
MRVAFFLEKSQSAKADLQFLRINGQTTTMNCIFSGRFSRTAIPGSFVWIFCLLRLAHRGIQFHPGTGRA